MENKMHSSFLVRSSKLPFSVSNSDLTDEDTMLDKLIQYVRKNRLRVPNPDYYKTSMFAPQWKALGSLYYWQSPAGVIVAVFDKTAGKCWFKEEGFKRIPNA